MRAAVLDACVLVPAALRDTLLRAAVYGLYRPCWTVDILEELRRTLAIDGFTDEVRADRLVAALEGAFPTAAIEGRYRELVPLMTIDPKDRHVLAAAVFAKAEIIVTSNLRHFPASSLVPLQIEAQPPDRFLVELFEHAPALALEIVAGQAAALQRPALGIEVVLRNLSRDAPAFASLVARQLAAGS